MKIIALSIDGVRKINALEMEFTDNGLIEIRGKNGQGKTSILDAFEVLIKGNKFFEKDMINHDKDKARIVGYIDDYKISRVITEKSSRLVVEKNDGSTVGKPQDFLDSIINGLTFNPFPFLNKTGEQKLKFLMDLFEIDFTDVNENIKVIEDERLLLGREIKNMQLTPVQKVDPVDVQELFEKKHAIDQSNNELMDEFNRTKEEKIKEISEFNAEQQKNDEIRMEKSNTLVDLLKEKEELETKLKDILIRVDRLNEEIESIPPRMEPMTYEAEIDYPILQDTKEIEEQITRAQETNIKASEYQIFLDMKKKKGKKQLEYDRFTNEIKILRNKKTEMLREIKVPVDGLEIREDGLYHNDIYSENWGEAEALKISSELCISMNPQLRAGFLDSGESFDDDSRAVLDKWAKDNDVQIFITIVDSDKGTSNDNVFYIEEGEIV